MGKAQVMVEDKMVVETEEVVKAVAKVVEAKV